jgi:hypothetical protein
MRNTLEYSRKAIRLMETAVRDHVEQETGTLK